MNKSQYYAVEENLVTGDDVSAIYGPGVNPMTDEPEVRRLWVSNKQDRKKQAKIRLKAFQEQEQKSQGK